MGGYASQTNVSLGRDLGDNCGDFLIRERAYRIELAAARRKFVSGWAAVSDIMVPSTRYALLSILSMTGA